MPSNFIGEFGLGVVTGVRAFLVNDVGMLTGIFYGQTWRADANNRARCRHRNPTYPRIGTGPGSRYDDDTDQAPECETAHMLACTSKCGFYGYYEGSNDYNPADKPHIDRVSGVVWGWGHCLIGTRGFRVSRARIVALVANPEIPNWDLVRENYAQIPMFRTFDEMVAEFPPDRGPVGGESPYKEETA